MLDKISNILLSAAMFVSIISAPVQRTQGVTCSSSANLSDLTLKKIEELDYRKRQVFLAFEAKLATLPEHLREPYISRYTDDLTKFFSSCENIYAAYPRINSLLGSGPESKKIRSELEKLSIHIGTAVKMAILGQRCEDEIDAAVNGLPNKRVNQLVARAVALQAELIAAEERQNKLSTRVASLSRELSRAERSKSQRDDYDDDERWLMLGINESTHSTASSSQ